MKLPGTDVDIDFSERSTQMIVGGLGLVGAFVVWQGRQDAKKPDVAAPVTANLSPGNGLQWSDVITPPDQRGTIGTVGPGEPVPGSSAYDLWLANGNQGTLQDFLDSLKGNKGDKGDKGDAGAPGTKPPTTGGGTKTPTSPTKGRGYHCPAGSVMTKERGAPDNDVCQLPNGTQFQVVYDTPPSARYPANAAGEGEPYNNPTPGGSIRGFFNIPSTFGGGKMVTVKPGDTLKSLAKQHYDDIGQWTEIVRKNPQAAHGLRVGNRLKIY